MEAGRELDALVAEKVMGHEWRDVRLSGETNTVRVLLHPSVHDLDGHYDRRSLQFPRHREYSTSISAAWEVVEKSGGMWVCPADDGHSWTANKLALEDPSPDGGVWAETAPLAICLAALKSVGVEP